MSVGARVVAAARAWIGTPYRHQASVKGVGCDCLGLVRGVWREVVGDEPERVPPYSPDWAEVSGAETLLDAARRYLTEIAIGEARVGDVLLFRMGLGAVAKHVGIVSAVEPLSAHSRAGGNPAESGILGPRLRGEERKKKMASSRTARGGDPGSGGGRGSGFGPDPASALPGPLVRDDGRGASRIIHAYWGRAVCETSLVPWWRRRIAGAFRFPDGDVVG